MNGYLFDWIDIGGYTSDMGNAYWVWVCRRGLWIGNTPKLFSERHGYVKSYPLPFGYRFKLLKKRGDDNG